MKARVIFCVSSLVMGVAVLSACTDDKNLAADAKLNQAKAAKAAAQSKLSTAAAAKANEVGDVPVLMYHRIVAKTAVPDDRTPAQFRAELERLAKEGYVPVTAAEYVTGRINIPAGRHPVVITLDDSSPSQLTLTGNGEPKADSAAGILREVATRYPGFRPVATYFVIRDLFQLHDNSDQRQALAWLTQNGFEVGNHTKDHMDLSGKSQEQVAQQIAAGQALITGLGAPAPITLALPYGNTPRKLQWAATGRAGATSYANQGVFRAGYTPAPSPFAARFDPLAIPRVRAGNSGGNCEQFCSQGWLDSLQKNPTDRYTSDGSPDTVAVPAYKAEEVNAKFRSKVLTYKPT
ncbi:polysaccharide deacetylase family protein [Spirillospora sp. NPDC048911]|uniref:polysaccharide deacetylase family protein n=1 Tax=Spirillospora sp. NPDC048911 TaxID=3364527 RepID=UPI003716CE81